jgi:hypothetical protein
MKFKEQYRLSPKRKVQDLMDSLLNSTTTFKEELIPTLFKWFHEIEKEGTVHNLFSEASNTLIPKQDKDTSKKEDYS